MDIDVTFKEPEKPSSPPHESREELCNNDDNFSNTLDPSTPNIEHTQSNNKLIKEQESSVNSGKDSGSVIIVNSNVESEKKPQSQHTGRIHSERKEKKYSNDSIQDDTGHFENSSTSMPSTSMDVKPFYHNGISGKRPALEDCTLEKDNEVKNRKKVAFYTEDTEPQWYEIKGNLVTPPMITGNLPKVFQSLPVSGRPNGPDDLEMFQMNKIREFVGCNLDDEEFNELAKYCSPMHLKIGKELIMPTSVPTIGFAPVTYDIDDCFEGSEIDSNVPELCTVTNCKLRERDLEFRKKLKYRGVRLMALPHEEENSNADDVSVVSEHPSEPDLPLEPGKDILYKVRVYRPFVYNANSERNIKIRHSVFSCDCVLLGRHTLTTLRDRFVCHNESDMRVDVSNMPDELPITTAKEIFPSGFLFINNVFYVDRRKGCSDHSAPLRRWAQRRGLGHFRVEDMGQVSLHQLRIKLGHPEVYVHQGNCEHLFTFSEIRLLGPSDPLALSYYPCHTAISQNQTIYCTTCAEFSAKWVVVGCNRVPFDPAFFCDTCFKLYLYKDGEKIGDFKAFSYRGNEINMLKPMG